MLPCRGESASVPGVPVWPWRSGAVGPFRPNGRRVPPSLLCVSLAQKARCVLGPAFARPPGGPGRSLCQTGRGGPRGAAGRRPPTASRSLPGLSFRFSRFPEFLLTFKRRLRLAARESCVLEPSWPEVAVGGQAPGTGKKREDKKKRISAGVSGPEARRDAWNGGVRRPTVRGEPGDLERFRGCEEPRWRKQRPLSAGETLSRFPVSPAPRRALFLGSLRHAPFRNQPGNRPLQPRSGSVDSGGGGGVCVCVCVCVCGSSPCSGCYLWAATGRGRCAGRVGDPGKALSGARSPRSAWPDPIASRESAAALRAPQSHLRAGARALGGTQPRGCMAEGPRNTLDTAWACDSWQAPQENYPSPPAASLHTSVVPGQHQAIAFGSCSPLPWACAAVGNLSQLKSLLTCFHGKPGW
nr:uncharacterized protein LOC127487591 [Oryctolagus cuniculus]